MSRWKRKAKERAEREGEQAQVADAFDRRLARVQLRTKAMQVALRDAGIIPVEDKEQR